MFIYITDGRGFFNLSWIELNDVQLPGFEFRTPSPFNSMKRSRRFSLSGLYILHPLFKGLQRKKGWKLKIPTPLSSFHSWTPFLIWTQLNLNIALALWIYPGPQMDPPFISKWIWALPRFLIDFLIQLTIWKWKVVNISIIANGGKVRKVWPLISGLGHEPSHVEWV